MRATRWGETTDIMLIKEDREILESGRGLRTYLLFDSDLRKNGIKSKLVLKVRDYAEPNPDQMKFDWWEHPPNPHMSLFLTERGWWYEVFPPLPFMTEHEKDRHYRAIEEYDFERKPIDEVHITVNKKLWMEIVEGGHALTRWRFDRLQIRYWEEGMVEKNV